MTSILSASVAEDLARVEERFRDIAGSGSAMLQAAAGEALPQGGKRLRPTLVLLSGRLFTYDVDRLVPLAVALEMVHVASLVHDDIIDRAEARRGAPTVNHTWGADVAILVGDYFFAKTSRAIAEVESHRVIRVVADTIGNICEGALLELLAVHNPEQTAADYLERISKKTASLLSTCCSAAGLVHRCSQDEEEALASYGLNLGLAYQIIDDVLDYAGDAVQLGKPTGLDLAGGSMTLPLLHFIAHDGQPPEIRTIVSERDADPLAVRRIVAAVAGSPSIQACLDQASEYGRAAIDALSVFPRSPARQELEELVPKLLQRLS